MAQVASIAPLPVGTDGVPLTAEELREVLEYEKIVQFRDAVLAGIHPRVKIPSHLAGKQLNTTRNTSSPNISTPTPRTNPPSQSTRSASGTYYENSSPYRNNRSPSNFRAAAGGHISMASKSEINPILLEKSDDLIKAEIQLQRQRLERALREQIEQQRLTTKALLQTSESLPNFDLSEVLSKALAIVHPSTSAEIASIDASASDSFDENTFYSSQHDTPEPSSSPQSQKDTAEAKSRGLVSVDKRPSELQVEDQPLVMTGASLSQDNHLATLTNSHQQPSQQLVRNMDFEELPSQIGNLESSRSHTVNVQDPSKMITQDNGEIRDASSQLLRQAFGDNTASPLVRAHNLSPLAPQPARVSPLATARDPPILREDLHFDEAPPAQVAALRQKPSGFSSTDSSPKGVKDSGKKKSKKEKKKKRKASSNDNAADTPESPYIKPEPRSPSPFAVAPLPRPQKRQRQMGQYAAELNYDEPRYEATEELQERVSERYKEVQPTRAYDRPERQYDIEPRRPEPRYQRLERDNGDHRRVSSGYYAKRPESPVYYAPSEARPARAVSHAIVDRRVYEEPVYYKDPIPIPRASIRPDGDRDRSRSPIMRERRSSPIPMGPPRRPVRIVVDEYGREYIDPTPVPSIRQSVAPPSSRYRDEVIYERAAPRNVPVRAPPEEYEQDGLTYRRPSPSIAMPRRVITQPEYAIPAEYRSYRQREYSTRPMQPPGEEYVQVRTSDRRFEEAPREYVSRAPSVRPEAPHEEAPREYVRASTARPEQPVRYGDPPREYVRAPSVHPEHTRYEIPRDYRLQSVRPQPPLREYAASVRPEARREMPREFSVRPVDSVAQPVAENERGYYDEFHGQRRNPAEVAFVERPRAREASVMIYADDVRREVYR